MNRHGRDVEPQDIGAGPIAAMARNFFGVYSRV